MFGTKAARNALARADAAERECALLARKVEDLEGRHIVHQNRLTTLALRDTADDRLAAHVASVATLIHGLNQTVGRLGESLRDTSEILAARETAKAEFIEGLKQGYADALGGNAAG